MNVEVFCLSDFAQDNNGKLSIMGAFDTIWVKTIPAQHPFMCVAGRIRFGMHELGKHSIRVEFKDPDGQYVVEAFDNPVQLDNISDDSAVTGLVLQYGALNIVKNGKYTIKLIIDGKEVSIIPLYVKQVK